MGPPSGGTVQSDIGVEGSEEHRQTGGGRGSATKSQQKQPPCTRCHIELHQNIIAETSRAFGGAGRPCWVTVAAQQSRVGGQCVDGGN